MKRTNDFDNFALLFEIKTFIDLDTLPNEDLYVRKEYGMKTGDQYVHYFLSFFYINYSIEYKEDFLRKKANLLEDEKMKKWVFFAIEKIPTFVELEKEESIDKLEMVLEDLKIHDSNLNQLIEPYLPFFTYYDCYRFAYENLDSDLFKYFYIFLIVMHDDEYPTPIKPILAYDVCNEKEKEKCELQHKCKHLKSEYCLKSDQNEYYEKYDIDKELISFQQKITKKFLYCAPNEYKERALVRLYEAFGQINRTNLYEKKLTLSYDKVLYGKVKPMTGYFFLQWDKVEFYDGFYLVKHPNVAFNKINPFRVNDTKSRKAYNDIGKFFLKKLPPLMVSAKEGRIINVLNRANLDSCITLMEHEIYKPNVHLKKKEHPSFEKKVLTISETKKICNNYKSQYLDFLCQKQIDTYNVICCIEHRVNSEGNASSEYSFIFTIKEQKECLFLVYENTAISRSTYVLPIAKDTWQESIDNIYNFFASDKVNKRQLMAANLIDLKLPGNYKYHRFYHIDYQTWVMKIKSVCANKKPEKTK